MLICLSLFIVWVVVLSLGCVACSLAAPPLKRRWKWLQGGKALVWINWSEIFTGVTMRDLAYQDGLLLLGVYETQLITSTKP